ncbi:MAG: SpoIIE family protein phosphatase [Gemmataceae bacterium]|nr:SpoIIE family protein phosphatase [Gemmataceae bacterium]
MDFLLAVEGPEQGRRYPLTEDAAVLGRQHDSTICLVGRAVSRHHARLLRRNDAWYVEDLDSSNGTYVNAERLPPRTLTPLTERDTLQIGPYVFSLRQTATVLPLSEPDLIIRETVNAATVHADLLGADPSAKLRVVLDITHHLARSLDVDELLGKLLDRLMELFPQADRALAILVDGEQLLPRAHRARRPLNDGFPFSRTVVRRALAEGVGLISDDVKKDQRFKSSETLSGLELRSVMCVPMITVDGRRLGVLQLDRSGKGHSFTVADLHLATTIALQATVVLENAALHAERLHQERLRQELALARDIQQSYLPDEVEGFAEGEFEIFGRVYPARHVAGDYYDYFKTADGKLAFFIGDVSGKGMPAALFLGVVRTLARHLAKKGAGPAATLAALDRELADDNPACLFVTMAHGVYEPASGDVMIAVAGHPRPMIRRADGVVESLPNCSGRLLGYADAELRLTDHRLSLGRGDLLALFTDGISEARAANGELFGAARLPATLAALPTAMPLPEAAGRVKHELDRFTAGLDQRDDVTLLLLRRKVA